MRNIFCARCTGQLTFAIKQKDLWILYRPAKVDDKEKEKISTEVVELEKKISELKLKLNIGDKTEYKSQKKREV